MTVVDASGVTDVLAGTVRAQGVLWHLQRAEALAAPELLAVEVTSAVWRLSRTGVIPEERAERAMAALRTLPVRLVPHRGLLPRVWQLRRAVRMSDAFYLACCQQLGLPLLTTDTWLARAPTTYPSRRCRS